MYNKNENSNQTPASTGRARRTRVGSYSAIVTALILAVLIVANVILYSLPQEFTLFDTTQTEWTEVSEETLNFIQSVDTPISIYAICENEDINFQFNSLLQKYADANDNITVEVIDPIANPHFVEKYTDATISNNSVIVVSEKRSKVIDSEEMTYYVSQFINSLTGSESDYKMSYSEMQQFYQQYYQYMDIEQFFQAETLITSAIDYVTINNVPQTYVLETTGDSKMDEILTEMLTVNANLEMNTLNLKTSEAVPEDASCIIIYDAKDDITDIEYTKIEAFLNAGGSLCMITDPSNTGHKNLMKLAAIYGCAAEEGMVRDTETSHYNQDTSILLPEISTTHAVTYELLSSYYTVQFPTAHSIVISDELPEGVKADPLFYTSKKGYRVSTDDDSSRLDENSTHNIAVAASKKINDDSTSYFIWLGSTEALTYKQAQASGGGNFYYFVYGMRWMSEIFTSEYSSIASTNISPNYLRELTPPSVITWGIVFTVAIPAAILVSGFVIWFKRRRR